MPDRFCTTIDIHERLTAVNHPELQASSTTIRQRFHGVSPRQQGLVPLRDGLLDVAGELRALGELLGDHPMAPVIENAEEPWRGITTDGRIVPGLYLQWTTTGLT